MKKLIFISAVLSLAFLSCKKQRLNKEKEVFVGKWEFSYAISNPAFSQRGTIIYPNQNEPKTILNFKKSGKVIFNHKGEEQHFKMNFRDNRTGSGFFEEEMTDLSLWNDSAKINLGKFHSFSANICYGESYGRFLSLSGRINQEMLILFSDEYIISEGENLHYLSTYDNYFVRVE